ncbi:unnamed protein product [Euphydryas editha]|uniref:DDE Tnp4 domain-containing protein n=1 Tax=Euphydryas editha TaxID=104508 RepID=A0AAU9TMS0_EUPED|nr:unnamed protein product [Euphydryas editha]
MADDELVAAITFGLTYFYYKLKQEKEKRRKRRRWWMIKIHQNRTRQFIEEKFNELLYEPSGEFHNFCRMSFTDFEYLLDKISPLISKQDTDFREAIPAKYRLAITLSLQSNDVLRNEIKMPSTADAWMNIERGAWVVVENTFGVLTSVLFRIYRRPIDLDSITVSEITMTCVLLHNFLRKNSPERYTLPGTFDTIDRNGEIITRGSWRQYENEYNAIQHMPNVPRRLPMHAKQIREEFTLYFCNRIT